MDDSREAAASELPEARLVAHVIAQSRRAPSMATRERLAQALLDWFTAGWSATELPLAGRMRRLGDDLYGIAGAESGVPLFGGRGANALAAASVNAGIAHLREIDDAHRAAMLHPGVVSVSPVLAMAPELGLSRLDVIQAIIAGYEVALRLGEALGTRHAAIFHATATAGAVGAAAAAGVAMRLDESKLHHAMGLAATQAAGSWQMVDDAAHESKPLHPAFAVRNGMTAAFAARTGFPGARAFVTGARGLYRSLAGGGPLATLDGDLDAPARLHTATIKAWPACAQLFTPLDATLALIEAHAIRAEDVERVDVEIFPHALKIAGVDWPVSAAQTPFCLRYLTAVLLLRGRVDIADTETPELGSPVIEALGGKIHVRTVEAFQQEFPNRRPSRVTIQLRDGRRFTAYRDLRRGDPEDPLTWSAMQRRTRAFAPALDDATAAALIGWCESFTDAAADRQPGAAPPALFGMPASSR